MELSRHEPSTERMEGMKVFVSLLLEEIRDAAREYKNVSGSV